MGHANQVHTFDLSCASLFVKSFRIPLLDSAERRVNKNLDEAQARFIVDLARDEAIDAVRRYERGEGNARRVCEEFRYLWKHRMSASF